MTLLTASSRARARRPSPTAPRAAVAATGASAPARRPPASPTPRKPRSPTPATQRGVTVARFLATAGLSAARGHAAVHSNDQLDTAIDELAALRTALAQIGNNINQIAFVLNSGGHLRAGEVEHALGVLTGLLVRVDDAANELVKRRL
ncbi:hypothetical protein ACFRH6_05930 [Streptomyces sp. NPDC056749]|uniref:hypothetical protein n=1 Tax=Streptomyces sp. NPDC056749 TaxID=3345936 RepID=UPI0036AA4617